MTEAPDPRVYRWAALGLFVLLPILAVAGTVMNLVRAGETETLIVARQQMIDRMDASLARLGGGGAALGDTSAIYLEGDSAPIAGAALQQRLVAAVEAAGGRVIETQAVDEIEPDGEDDVRLRITLDVTNEGLRGLMHALETGLPLVVLDSLAVRQLPSAGETAGDDPTLRVDLGVRGFWRTST